MKVYLKIIVQQLRNYSATLDIMSILIDKPWALIDEEFEVQKLIFKRNKELILSKNGQVQIGKWDYFPEAKSLLIDRATDKILCNEAFIDNGIMILKLDGTDNKFFMLANENLVPDLDALKYLKTIRHQRLRIAEVNLSNGKILEIQREENQYARARIGNSVSVDADVIDDGKYQVADDNRYIEIQRGKISKILTETTHLSPDNLEIIIQQQNSEFISNGDYVYIGGKQIGDAKINFSASKYLIVRDGKVVRLERKNAITRWLSRLIKQLFNNYHE